MGKVFVGIQVPPEENQCLDESLNRLGYTFIEETDNVVYKTFLRGD
jgi:threonine dehydratase